MEKIGIDPGMKSDGVTEGVSGDDNELECAEESDQELFDETSLAV